MASSGIPLSIVVATAHLWPEIRVCIDPIYSDAVALGAEIILVDRTGSALPEDAASQFPQIIWLKRPGLSMYQLRAAGLREARGELVALVEDHCQPGPNWCAHILDAHREHPEAAMIGGAVENASRESIVSWASFFLGNGPSLPPIESRFQNKSCLQANISYKRRFLPRDIPPYGYMEWMHNLDLLRQGEQLRADDRIPVEHHQPVDFREACSLHFHVGRCVAGFRLPRIGPVERVVRLLAACSVMSPLLWLRSLWAVVRKRRHLGWLAISTPMIFVLAVCRAAGAVVGLIAGSGDSPLVVP